MRSESGRYDRIDDAAGGTRGLQRPARLAQGRARRRRGRAQGACPAGRRARPTTAARSCTASPRRSSRAPPTSAPSAPTSRPRSTCSCTTPGWTDKLQPVLGGINPVAAPFLSFSAPEPTGVVGVLAPDAPRPARAGRRARAGAGGRQHRRRGALRRRPLRGLDLGEVPGVSDVPGGVVNLLSGRRDELAPLLAGHRA